jgi:Dolichyl-phosphate-mannose-protein mannosyltransferase
MSIERQKTKGPLVIGLTVLVSYALVFPVGEYAVLDDWAYALSLKHLHDDGVLEISNWNPMSLVGHLFWSLLFTKTFGFSLTVTKISVVVLHLVECLALFRLLTLCTVPSAGALAAVAMLIFQPLHFPHCFMNMTDVPMLTWQLVALFCYVQGLSVPTPRATLWLTLGSLSAGFAFLIRQSGCLVPLALLVYLVTWNRKRITPAVMAAAFGPAALIGVLFELWYRNIHGPTAAFRDSTKVIAAFLTHPPLSALPYIALTILIHLGLFVAPLALALPLRSYSLRKGTRRGITAGASLLVAGTWAWYAFGEDRVFPYLRNVVTPYGISRPNEFIIGDRDLLWGREIGWLVSLAGLLGILAFIVRTFANTPKPAFPSAAETPTAPATVLRPLASILLGLQLLYLGVTTPILYDRHLLMLLPTAIILFCLSSGGISRLIYWRLALSLVPMAFYSIATTHDLHALSRAAFEAGNGLLRRKIDPLVINAGYAFDCWHTYDQRKTQVVNIPVPPWWEKDEWQSLMQVDRRLAVWVRVRQSSWWVGHLRDKNETRFAVTSSPLSPLTADAEFLRVVDKHAYSNWWPLETKYVYVLERTGRADDNHPPP